MNDATTDVAEGMPMQTFASCGKDTSGTVIPYAQCILVSSLPGSQTIGQSEIVRSNILDYIHNNIAVYANTNADHAAGYSIFALENTFAAPAGAFGLSNAANITVQEPWYIGFNSTNTPYDPYYNEEEGIKLWQGFAAIITNE